MCLRGHSWTSSSIWSGLPLLLNDQKGLALTWRITINESMHLPQGLAPCKGFSEGPGVYSFSFTLRCQGACHFFPQGLILRVLGARSSGHPKLGVQPSASYTQGRSLGKSWELANTDRYFQSSERKWVGVGMKIGEEIRWARDLGGSPGKGRGASLSSKSSCPWLRFQPSMPSLWYA